MAIALREAVKERVSSSNSIGLVKPTGLAVDDLLLVFICTYAAGAGDALATPSGWTRLHLESGPINVNGYWYYKIADSGDVAETQFDFPTATSGDNDEMNGIIAAYSGVDTTTPIHKSSFSQGNESTTTTIDVPGATPTEDGCEIITAAGVAIASSTWDLTTPPSGFTLLKDAIQNQFGDAVAFSDNQATAAATGGLTFTLTASGDPKWVGGTIALLPSGGGGGGSSILPIILQQTEG